MILHEGRVGNVDLVYPHAARLWTEVVLPGPVTKVKVLLRGIDIANAWGDRSLSTMRVRLDIAHGDGANRVEVIATLELADKSPTGDAMQVEILFTIIGE